MRNRSRRASIFFLPPAEAQGECAWRPPADVYRTRDGWLVKFDLAGVRPQDLTLVASGRRLTLSGVRRDWVVEEGWSHYSMEISYCDFERSLELPCDLERAEIALESRDGMLLVNVRVRGEARE